MRRRITADPHGAHGFSFSRAHLTDVRTAFARMIRRGEEKLHRLCELLCESYFDSPYTLQNVVIGEVETTQERFTLVQPLVPTDLYSHTDLDLGTRQLRRLRYHDGRRWSRAVLVANMVEYQPGHTQPVGHPQVHQPHQGGGANLEQGGRHHLRI